MSVIRKLFPFMLLISLVLAFQNCSQYKFYGNGDVYEFAPPQEDEGPDGFPGGDSGGTRIACDLVSGPGGHNVTVVYSSFGSEAVIDGGEFNQSRVPASSSHNPDVYGPSGPSGNSSSSTAMAYYDSSSQTVVVTQAGVGGSSYDCSF